jgi:cyclic pyranopterin phosphate synthase
LTAPPEADVLVDSFGRLHSDLRISVTDRCNIRCFYCMPETAAQFAPISSLLSFAQIERLVRVAVPLGIRKIRLTGGEPLLRPRLPDLISRLSGIEGIQDLALTTNAVILAEHARALYEAGLRRLNIHLDTLDRERFRQIARRDDLGRVLAGIEAAQHAGFRSIKLNAVAVKNLSEPDLVPLVRFARERKFEVRFIEFMPLDAQEIWSLDQVLTAADMIRALESEFGPLTPVSDADPRAPATEYQFTNGDRVGFIASVSRPFCLNCNRLRLTSDGKLRNCLFAQSESDVKHLLSREGTDGEISAALRANVWGKWIGHEINRSTFKAPDRPMYSIGG